MRGQVKDRGSLSQVPTSRKMKLTLKKNLQQESLSKSLDIALVKKLGKKKKDEQGERTRVMRSRIEVKIVKEWIKKNGTKKFEIAM